MTPPLEEREPFLRAIIAEPDDDAVRLVYSDWLEEHGDIERATFIRTSIQLANATLKDATLSAENARIVDRCWKRWLEQDGFQLAAHWSKNFCVWPQFRRGFVESARYENVRQFFIDAPSLFATAPVRTLTIHAPWDKPWNDARLTRLAAMPDLARIHTLLLSADRGVETAGWKTLFHSDNLRNLRTLGVRHCDLTQGEFAAIASSPSLENLETLDLSDNRTAAANYHALISATGLRRVRRLYLFTDAYWVIEEEEQAIAELQARFGFVTRDDSVFEEDGRSRQFLCVD